MKFGFNKKKGGVVTTVGTEDREKSTVSSRKPMAPPPRLFLPQSQVKTISSSVQQRSLRTTVRSSPITSGVVSPAALDLKASYPKQSKVSIMRLQSTPRTRPVKTTINTRAQSPRDTKPRIILTEGESRRRSGNLKPKNSTRLS